MKNLFDKLDEKVSTEGDDKTLDLMENTPIISDKVYNSLPPLFKTINNSGLHKNNARNKDVIFLSSLVSLSSLFPGVYTRYAGRKYYSNLYFFLAANAASGKSSMRVGKEILKNVIDDEKKENAKLLEKYKQDLQTYENKKKNKENTEVPAEPKIKTHIIGANISSAELIEKINSGTALMFDSEADVLAQTMKKEWGDISPELRCISEHEEITKNRKSTGTLTVECPKMSLSLSGTLDQLFQILGKSENGLYSRFLIYTFYNKAEYISQRTRITSQEYLTEHVTDHINMLTNFWKDKDVDFDLKDEQWVLFDEYSSKLFTEYKIIDEREIDSVLKRYITTVLKITMLFTIIRRFNSYNPLFEAKLYPIDNDIKISFNIINTLLKHTSLIYYSQNEKKTTLKENKLQKCINKILSLQNEFKKQDIINLCKDDNISDKTIERAIKKLKENKKIEQLEERGLYKKII